jgi:hypothetical protein
LWDREQLIQSVTLPQPVPQSLSSSRTARHAAGHPAPLASEAIDLHTSAYSNVAAAAMKILAAAVTELSAIRVRRKL